MGHPDHVLVAGLGPARGPAEGLGHPADHRVLGVGAELGAERAADVRRDDPDRLGVQAEHVGQVRARSLRALVRYPRGQPAVRPDRRRCPGLHRRGRDPLVDDRPGDDHLAPFEQVRVERPAIAERRRHIRPGPRKQHGRPVLRGQSHVDDYRQLVIIDLNQRPGVLALVRLLGYHRRDRLADEPHHVAGEQRLAHLRVDHGHRLDLRQVRQVRGGERGQHAGGRKRGADVNRPDPRVRKHRPNEVHITRAV